MNSIKLISGTANRPLGESIAKHLGVRLTPISLKRFADGEIYVQVQESVRGHNCFIVQSTCSPVNDNLLELLLIIDALKRASARSITAIIPYFGYARQDRKAEPREAISAKLVADLITKAGAQRVLTIDLHTPQIQGFFDIPEDDLWALPIISSHLLEKSLPEMVVVSPDIGGAKRARFLAKLLHCPIAIIDKRRTAHNECEVMHIVGEVADKTAILVDDIIDTAGTITQAASALSQNKAKAIIIAATHAILSGPAIERLASANVQEIVVTDTIPVRQEARERLPALAVLSVAPLLAQAIRNIASDQSVSGIFTSVIKEADDESHLKKGLHTL